VGPVLFSDILFVCHTIGKYKAEEEEIRMGKHKTYRVCPTSLQKVTVEEICTLCAGLKSNQNSSTFTRLLRGNDCNPVTDDSEVGSSSGTIRVQEVESQHIETLQEMNDNYVDHINIDNEEIDADDKKEAVFLHIRISQETAKKIQMNTMHQSEFVTWYKEHQYRITASYFAKVSKMHKLTSPVRLATTITSRCVVVLGEGIMSQML